MVRESFKPVILQNQLLKRSLATRQEAYDRSEGEIRKLKHLLEQTTTNLREYQ